jgi:hypothetical protein
MCYEIVLSVKNMTLVRFWNLTDYDKGRFYIDKSAATSRGSPGLFQEPSEYPQLVAADLPSALEHIFDIRLSGIVFSI